MNYLALILLTGLMIGILGSSCPQNPPGKPSPTPQPSPVASPKPTPFNEMTLHTVGSNFYDPKNNKVFLLGAIICCDYPGTASVDEGKEDGWPLITNQALDLMALYKSNFTHIRLGPFTDQGEGPEFVAFKPVGNKVDLYQWNPAFWKKVREVIEHARRLKIYVEVDVVDAWVLERPELSPWSAQNNINGIDEGDCRFLKHHPLGIHEMWIRKVALETGFYDNVLYEISNESSDCNGQGTSVAWEKGVADIIRDELNKNSYPLKPVGSNSEMGMIEESEDFDYIIRHSNNVQPPKNNNPVMVNEQNGEFVAEQGPNGYDRFLRESYRQNTMWQLWRGAMSRANYLRSLDKLKKFRTEHPF